MIKKLVLLTAALITLWLIFAVVRFLILSSKGGMLIRSATPFERKGNSNQKILVLGDSLAYGTGTSSPEHSIAGRVASKYPEAQVENRSKNGMRTHELSEQVKQLNGHYDVILIVIGGNDVMRPWIDLNQSGKNLETIYAGATQHADKVIAFSTGNMRTTTFFPWPLNYVVGSRSVSLRDKALKAANAHKNVYYIDMVAYNERVPFTSREEAPDHLHLSDAGTEYWFQALQERNIL